MKILKNNQGFSLLEIMIAFLCFSVFFVVFISSQTKSTQDSYFMDREVTLTGLAERVINELTLNPPTFRDTLTIAPETKQFPESELADYQYIVEYKKFEIPNLFDMAQSQDEDGKQTQAQAQGGADAYKNVFNQITEGIKNIIWQVRVTVKDKNDGLSVSLSTWLKNEDAPLKIGTVLQQQTQGIGR